MTASRCFPGRAPVVAETVTVSEESASETYRPETVVGAVGVVILGDDELVGRNYGGVVGMIGQQDGIVLAGAVAAIGEALRFTRDIELCPSVVIELKELYSAPP